jgi:hypothetical protein
MFKKNIFSIPLWNRKKRNPPPFRPGWGKLYIRTADVAGIFGLKYHTAHRHLIRERVFRPALLAQGPKRSGFFWTEDIILKYATRYNKTFNQNKAGEYLRSKKTAICIFCRRGTNAAGIYDAIVLWCRCGADLKSGGYYFL